MDKQSEAVRDQAIKNYLERQNLQKAHCSILAADASFRRYFRLIQNQKPLILMDAPAPHECIEDFLRVAEHLQAIGLRPPKLYHSDTAMGFALLEDLGDNSFTTLLKQGQSELELYQLATHVLLKLHKHKSATSILTSEYNFEQIKIEADLFLRWYYPLIMGKSCSDELLVGWQNLWHELYLQMPFLEPVLVLRDFHVDNLMKIYEDHKPVCALLDFQDALIGQPAYDLLSLLEDARRMVTPDVYQNCYKAYLDGRPNLDQALFKEQFNFFAAQRHVKVLGIFARLCLRDNKPQYLGHIPRVIDLLKFHLEDESLYSLKSWLLQYFPSFFYEDAFIQAKESLSI